MDRIGRSEMSAHLDGHAAGAPNHERVVRAVRECIVESDLQPGAHISERHLCEALKLSRAPVREALKVLANEGLIELQANRGARIVQFSRADIVETFELIAGLEALAGRLAAEKITDEEIEFIRETHFRMYDSYIRRDQSQYFQANENIHTSILRAARNSRLEATYQTLAARIKKVRYSANSISEDRWAEAVREHEIMLDAIQRRSANDLANVLYTHLIRKCDVILSSLDFSRLEIS